jgi:hypothetical protein
MSSLVSLGIAFTGLLLSIFAFMLKDASRAVRYGVGVFFLSITLLFGLIAVFSFIGSTPPGNGGAPPDGSCNSNPVNAQDGVAVALSASSWYMMEDYDNSTTPPIHRFIAKLGSGSVIANAIQGQRAWRCTDREAAISTALSTASQFRQQCRGCRVYGPNGEEIP